MTSRSLAKAAGRTRPQVSGLATASSKLPDSSERTFSKSSSPRSDAPRQGQGQIHESKSGLQQQNTQKLTLHNHPLEQGFSFASQELTKGNFNSYPYSEYSLQYPNVSLSLGAPRIPPSPPSLSHSSIDIFSSSTNQWTRGMMTRSTVQDNAELAEAPADSASTSAPICSHCGWFPGKNGVEADGPFFCGSCNFLMPVDKSMGEFQLFNLDPRFALDISALEQQYKQLQRKLHPDKFASSASEEDKERSAEWSALVIGAYYTLLRPLSRARCLMRGRAGDGFDNSESTLEDQDLLMEIMETRERVEEADERELREMKEEFTGNLEQIGKEFNAAFERNDIEKCQHLVHRMTYCCRIIEEITRKL